MSTGETATGNPIVHPFQVYSVLSGEQNKHVAGGADLASAVTLAGAAFVAAQEQGSQLPLFFVYDSTGEVVAFIGDTGKAV